MVTFKFLTLNILEGGLLFDNIIPFLKAENPDILTLQEVFAGNNLAYPRNLRSIQVLKKILPGFNYRFAPEFLDNRKEGKVESGNAVFTRFPILSSNVTFYDIPFDENFSYYQKNGDYSLDPCNLQETVVKIEDRLVHIFNTHGVWGLDGKDNPRRLHMGKFLAKSVAGKEYVILAGDMNVAENTKTIGYIEKYLTNVFKGELTSTFNMKRKTDPGYATAAVDMVFVSKNISVVNKKCPDADVSDHLPLLCTLEI